MVPLTVPVRTSCKAGYIFNGTPLIETVTSAPTLIAPFSQKKGLKNINEG